MARAPKIIVVAEASGSGGARTYARELFFSLNQQKNLVEFYFFAVGNQPDHASDFGEIRPFSIKQVAPSWWLFYFPPAWKFLAKALSAAEPGDKIVISSGVPGLFFSPWVRRNDVFYILHTYPHSRFHRFFGFIFGLLLPANWSIVTVSHFAASQIRRLWRLDLRKIPVTVVHTGLRDVATENAVSTRGGDDRGITKVLCVAACEDYKSPDFWLDVATRAHVACPGSFFFTWVGGGSLIDVMRHQVAARGLEGVVNFLGHKENPHEIYEESDVYMQLSTVDNFPLSVVDACQHSLPVIVSNVGGMPEIVGNGESGLVVPLGDVEAAWDALYRLRKGSRDHEFFGKSSRKRYEIFFNHSLWQERIASLLGVQH